MEMFSSLWNSVRSKEGQGLVEYMLILVLVAIIVILILTGIGDNVNESYSHINSAMPK